MLALQQQLFISRRQALNSEIVGHHHAAAGLEIEINGLTQSLASKRQQLVALDEQKTHLRQLAADGYLPRNRYLDMQNQHASLPSRVNEVAGRLSKLKLQRQETLARIAQRQVEYQREVSTRQAETRENLVDVENQLQIAEQDWQHTHITAPVSSSVVGLKAGRKSATRICRATTRKVTPPAQTGSGPARRPPSIEPIAATPHR